MSREYGASLLSRIFFLWVVPFMKVGDSCFGRGMHVSHITSIFQTGYLRELEVQDIPQVNPSRSVNILVDKVDAVMPRRRARGSKRPLLGSIYDTFKKELWIGGICQLVSFVIIVVAPYLVIWSEKWSPMLWKERNLSILASRALRSARAWVMPSASFACRNCRV